jgi:chromate transporter
MIKNASLAEIAKIFLKLGFTSFGGPAAHIAMMRSEVVDKKKWLSEKEFLDLLGAVHLIPGPNSTELAIIIGHKLQKFRGLFVAGICFILPAFLIVLFFAFLYQKYGSLPNINPVLIGIRPVVIAVVILALYKFSKTALFNASTFIMFGMSALLSYSGLHELIIIFGLGFFQASLHSFNSRKMSLSLELFGFFLKVGSVLFGSGYVLLAFLQEGLVENHQWITQNQLLDAITIGQVTPGPVFTSATFVGYLIDGFNGASFSTLGIFLPSFVLVALIVPFFQKLRSSIFFSHFLDGVNAASMGLMVFVLVHLSQKSFINLSSFFIGLISILFLLKFKNLNSVFPVIVAGIFGYFFL